MCSVVLNQGIIQGGKCCQLLSHFTVFDGMPFWAETAFTD